ncbi:MAG: D-tagatose 3-epimerase [Verrucomicrobia subdivision 3 bacterium]|nr:D-tagatose 3-epimerase [Limisphaerales bacterium]MCS1414032.1 D-tagatose 3-epimerase [Limisphaerales bacterium]
MKFGICNEIFKDWEIERAIRFAKDTGYDAIEIAPFTLANYVTDIPTATRHKIRQTAQDVSIEISAVHWVLVQAEGMYMTHTDATIREKTAQYFCDLVDFCGDLGGKAIVVGSPKQRNLLPGITFDQAWAWAKQVFHPSIARAAERDVIICFEPLAPAETDFINTAEEAIRFTKEFDSPNFKIILDVKAMCSMSKPIPEIIKESAGEFAYFHANDENLKGPGFGEVDFQPIAQALKEVGYEGYVSVEVFNFNEGPEVIAKKSLEYLRKSFA